MASAVPASTLVRHGPELEPCLLLRTPGLAVLLFLEYGVLFGGMGEGLGHLAEGLPPLADQLELSLIEP